jgi:hypothetical protein
MILITSEHTQKVLKKYPSCDTLPLKDGCVHNLDHRGEGERGNSENVSALSAGE